MTYTVTAPLVIIPNVDGTSGDGYFYQGATVPDGWNDERCKELAQEGMLEKGKSSDSSSSGDAGSNPDTIEAILADVGDDKDKAAAALETEKAGKNRSTLVSKLEAIANPA